MNKGQLRISFALGLIYLIWGTSYYAIGVGVQYTDPFLFCGLRFLIAAPILFIVGLWRGEKLPSSLQQWVFNAFCGVLLMGVSSSLLAWGQQAVPSSQSALIIGTSALWIALFGAVGKRGKPLTSRTWLCLCTGLLGLGLILELDTNQWQKPDVHYLAILASAFSLSLATTLVRAFGNASSYLITAATHLWFSGLVVVTIGLARSPNFFDLWHKDNITALVYVAVFNSTIAVAAYYWLIHRISPALLGSFAYVTPAIAITTGYLVGGEVLTPVQFIGGLLILVAVFLHVFPSGDFRKQALLPTTKKKGLDNLENEQTV